MHFIQDFESVVAKLKPFLADYLQEQGIDPTQNFSCPFPGHEDRNPSCNMVGGETDTPRVHCYGCGKSGDLFDIVQIFENKPTLGVEWVEDTLKYLASKYGIEIETKDLTEEQIYELDTYRAYRAAAELITTKNIDKEKHSHFLDHTEKRGWNADTLAELGVGTVSSWEFFRESLKQQGFSAAFLDEIDLGSKKIFNENNLIFTWKDEKGRPIGFTSRNLFFEQQKEEAERNGKKPTQPKYTNQRTTGLRCNIFQKGRRFYGIDGAIKTTPPLYIFEGQTDVITARHYRLANCVAIAGSSLHTNHVLLLKDLGIYDVIVCLDSDEAGQKKLAQILEERFAGHREMKVRVVILPEGEDPDSFIRKNGIEAFKSLACWSAFEWRLNQYEEEDDPEDICNQMIPFIVNEASPIAREQLCKTLSRRTGVSLRAVNEELSILIDAKAQRRSRERQALLDRAVYELTQDPSNAELILHKAQTELSEILKKHDADILSNETFAKAIDEQKENEEKDTEQDVGFDLGPDLQLLREILRGEWSKDVFMCLGSKPNVGKTSLLCKVAYEIATRNEDVCVIIHTIDDTLEQVIPRLVTIAESNHCLSINMVRQPKYWSRRQELANAQILKRREKGYQILKGLAAEGKLIIKDLHHGGSLPFAESLVKYYQEKYPERRIVYILDNFHKLRDFTGKDERVRFKQLSEAIKGIALRYHIAILCSVEYTKLPRGVKPTNYNVAESSQIEYDANFIAHLYSEVADIPDSFTVCHHDVDWKGDPVMLPRVEMSIGKNKITEQKGTIFLDFWPASSDYRYVSQETVIKDSQKMKEMKRNQEITSNDIFDV